MKKVFGFIFSSILLIACTPELKDNQGLQDVGIVVSAKCLDTKSFLDSGHNVIWDKDDRIAVISLDGSVAVLSEKAGAEAAGCEFRVAEWPNNAVPRYAVFDGSLEEISTKLDGRYLKMTIRSVQYVRSDVSFAHDANISVGELKQVTEGSWETEMKNVCALVGFRLGNLDNVKTVVIRDKSGANTLSGTYNVFMEDGIPVIKDAVSAITQVAVSVADNESLLRKNVTYYACVRPNVSFKPEFLFVLSDGTVYEHTCTDHVRISRSSVMDLGVVDENATESALKYNTSNENFVEGGIVNPTFWENNLTADCHPRIIFTAEEFDALKAKVNGTDALSKLHSHMIRVADEAVANQAELKYVLDASNKRILDVSRDALARLVPCAYAYRLTEQTKYLQAAVRDLTSVCSFKDWHPDHYLDVAEMATAVALAYDWLYNELDASVKSEAVRALKDYALQTSRDKSYTWWYARIGNWNQVCNGGLVTAALAIHEHCPDLAKAVIDEAITTNRVAVEGIYGPDGAYPEGPTYWGYGTLYQVLMLTALETVMGTDNGISTAPGFMDTGLFKLFSRGSMGMNFNYADNSVSNNSNYSMYYFAYKRNEPSMLYSEMELLEDNSYTNSDHKGLLPLAIKYAMQMDLKNLTGPTAKFYSAQGNVPIMMCRSGWDTSDQYLGIKGGQDGYLHGHMDGGEFVYYADKVRWAMDYVRQSYTDVENGIAALGGRLADYTQNSLRWRLFRLNCRQHNTLTVNDKDHNVEGFVSMIATENTSSRMAATFDLAPLFDGDLVTAERTAALCNEEYIEIKDVLEAPAGKSAHVRWTMVSKATPEITSDGIRLSRNGKTRILKTQGAKVTYRIWSSNPLDYDSPLKHLDAYDADSYICGYEIDIPAGTKYDLVTTLKKY